MIKGVRHQSGGMEMGFDPPPKTLIPVSKVDTLIDSRFIIGVGGIYGTYLLYGLLQEGIYSYGSDGQRFAYTWTLLTLQCITNVCGAFAVQTYYGHVPRGVPPTAFILPATTYIIAMMSSNEALKYVSFPTQVLAKSCKMVPVMVIKVLRFGEQYKFRDYFVVLLVTMGIITFRWNSSSSSSSASSEDGTVESKEHEANSAYGLGLLLLSLACDGMTGPNQDYCKTEHGASGTQIMMYCNLWALVFTISGVAYVDGLDGFEYLLNEPALLNQVIIFCVMSALGQNFIFYTLHSFGSLVLATVTTTRKFFTVLASVVYFGHALSNQQWGGVALVTAGLGLELFGKFRRQQELIDRQKSIQ